MAETREQLILERAELGAKYPPPYTLKVMLGGKKVQETRHETLASLEIEVDVAKNMIAAPGEDGRKRADDYVVEGFPKEKLRGRLEHP